MKSCLLRNSVLIGALLAIGTLVQAQVAPQPFIGLGGGLRAPRAPKHTGPMTGRATAPIDLTGYWVSIITEDWRWRMLTPARGDTASVPISPAGLKIANQFDQARYGGSWSQHIDCRAYYMAGLLRMPERVHITWSSPDALKLETDWGEQTRTLFFQRSQIPQGAPTPQGSSYAEWVLPLPMDIGEGGTVMAPPPGHGYLQVDTDNLTPGWLRRNGVPYGSKARVKEYFQTFVAPADGTQWFDVTSVVTDPDNLVAPYITSSDFRREANGSKWAPHPCVNVEVR